MQRRRGNIFSCLPWKTSSMRNGAVVAAKFFCICPSGLNTNGFHTFPTFFISTNYRKLCNVFISLHNHYFALVYQIKTQRHKLNVDAVRRQSEKFSIFEIYECMWFYIFLQPKNWRWIIHFFPVILICILLATSKWTRNESWHSINQMTQKRNGILRKIMTNIRWKSMPNFLRKGPKKVTAQTERAKFEFPDIAINGERVVCVCLCPDTSNRAYVGKRWKTLANASSAVWNEIHIPFCIHGPNTLVCLKHFTDAACPCLLICHCQLHAPLRAFLSTQLKGLAALQGVSACHVEKKKQKTTSTMFSPFNAATENRLEAQRKTLRLLYPSKHFQDGAPVL